MTQLQVDRVSRVIQACGFFSAGSPDPAIDIVECPKTCEEIKAMLGTKVLEKDGTITVTPPPAPPPPPPTPDYGADVPDDYQTQLANAVNQLRQYLGVASPSQAQSTAALKLLIRVVLFIAKRFVG
jgi:hypothetical protein